MWVHTGKFRRTIPLETWFHRCRRCFAVIATAHISCCSPEKYVQVGPEACEDVPPGMELCHYSDPRGKSLPAGSERPKKVKFRTKERKLQQNGIDQKRMLINCLYECFFLDMIVLYKWESKCNMIASCILVWNKSCYVFYSTGNELILLGIAWLVLEIRKWLALLLWCHMKVNVTDWTYSTLLLLNVITSQTQAH